MMYKNSGQIDMFDYMIFEKLIPKDPVMMVKILLLEYLYCLSDVQVKERTKTDVVFRWFLKLSIDDSVPDDTTISFFRNSRLTEIHIDDFFNEIVIKCMEYNLIKTNRHMIDSTDVAANVNYPLKKRLIEKAYNNVIKEISKFNETIAKEEKLKFEHKINEKYENNKKVRSKIHFEIAKEQLDYLYTV